MVLKKYEYGKTRFALDISKVLYISVLGDRFIEMTFRNGNEKSIPFENRSNRDQFYDDILNDIEAINKPIEITAQTLLINDPYLNTNLSSRMKEVETERDDKRYCSTCVHLGEPGWLCFEECSDKYHDAWIPKL